MELLKLNSMKIAVILDNETLVFADSQEEQRVDSLRKLEREVERQFSDPSLTKDDIDKLINMLDAIQTKKILPQLIPGHGMEKSLERTLKKRTPYQLEKIGNPEALIKTAERLIKNIESSPLDVSRKNEVLSELETIIAYVRMIKEEIEKTVEDANEKYGQKLSDYFNRLQELEFELYPVREEVLPND